MRWVALLVLVMLAVALAIATIQRNALFASPVALWEDAVRKAPAKGRPHVNLGLAYLAEGRIDEAEAEFTIALHHEPWLAAAGITDRGLLHRLGRHTVKTRMSENGIDDRVSEHVLGHVVPDVGGIYNHAQMMPQRREAAA